MFPSTQDIVSLLQRVHLLRPLSQEHTLHLAQLCEVHEFEVGEVVYRQGDTPEWFYLIYSGEVEITARLKSRDLAPTLLARLQADDYFGERAVQDRLLYDTIATPTRPTILLAINKKNFRQLLHDHPSILSGLKLTQRTRELMRLPRYRKWLDPDESLVLICGTHWPWLLRQAVLPTLLFLLALIGVVTLAFLSLTWWPALAAIAFLYTLWLGFLYLDWQDDTYVVTNKRVVSDERMALVYTTRAEASLHRVRAVEITQGTIEQVFNYGNVVVQAFAGRVVFPNVLAPQAVHEIISEQVRRAKSVKRRYSEQSLQEAIRIGIGWEVSPEPPPPPPPPPQPSPTNRVRGVLIRFLPRFREQYGNTITWRKHPLMLLRRIAGGLTGTVVVLGATLLRMWPGSPIFPEALVSGRAALWFGMMAPALLFFLGWAWYKFEDWRNDTYTLTPDRLIDSEKKPLLGRLTQRSAPVDSVLNVSYDRPGILANLFNYGTVTIQTGGEAGQLTFDWVINPLSVQQEIFLRLEQRYQQREDAEASRRWSEIVEWLTAYAQVTRPQQPEE